MLRGAADEEEEEEEQEKEKEPNYAKKVAKVLVRTVHRKNRDGRRAIKDVVQVHVSCSQSDQPFSSE